MPTQTGYWKKEEIEGQHVFSFELGRWLAVYLEYNVPVIDLGCGKATYLWLMRHFYDKPFEDLTGVEGEDHGQFEHENIFIQDLTQPFDLQKRGNVICLEVAEHIPAEYQDDFLENVTRHVATGAKLVMSWAVPGQAGYGHVNCRCNIDVIQEMKNRGFELLPEPTLKARAVIEDHCSWFRNTILIFQNENA